MGEVRAEFVKVDKVVKELFFSLEVPAARWYSSPSHFPQNGPTGETMRLINRVFAAAASVAVLGGLSSFASAQTADVLGLQVDVSTGAVRLIGNTTDGAEFVSYQINSASLSLNSAGFFGLADQGIGGFLELLVSEASIAEGTFGFPLVAGGAGNVSFSLGNAFDIGGTRDLVFTFGDELFATRSGEVVYINVPEPTFLGFAALGGLLALARDRSRK